MCRQTKPVLRRGVRFRHGSLFLLFQLYTKLCLMLVTECMMSRALPPVAIDTRSDNRSRFATPTIKKHQQSITKH